MQRATATANLAPAADTAAVPEGSAGAAGAGGSTSGCSDATGACSGGGDGGGSPFETQPRDNYWWNNYGRTMWHLDRVWAPVAWDTTTGSKQVRGSCVWARALAADGAAHSLPGRVPSGASAALPPAGLARPCVLPCRTWRSPARRPRR